ncbi:endopygalactorunase [Desertivirga arenae]|uniref:endopygalactorunase n=1 Tax=Desertivirga arenae TaxID=2810309 RepID=UPI001F6111A2|nr:endopygalactorunase [Pedobacter sp. SYSU D00823]
MIKVPYLIICFFLFSFFPLTKGQSIDNIRPSNTSPHIVSILKDTIILIAGTTMRHTVDTPKGKGLTRTGVTASLLSKEIVSANGSAPLYKIITANHSATEDAELVTGDRLLIESKSRKNTRSYYLKVRRGALKGNLQLGQASQTKNTKKDLILYFTAGQRSPNATVRIYLPEGVNASMESTTVNVIGRGDVTLNALAAQSIGRTGTRYSYSKVGDVQISILKDRSSIITFTNLDLRPSNGPDLKLVIKDVKLAKEGKYYFKSQYITSEPEVLTSPGTGSETATLQVTNTISDFARIVNKDLSYKETAETYTSASFSWAATDSRNFVLQQSLDEGRTWRAANAEFDKRSPRVTVKGLSPEKLYAFRLFVKDGSARGGSNFAWFYTGKKAVEDFGINGDPLTDNTTKIDSAINFLNKIGGGTLFFSKGVYSVRTVHLRSNVYLYLDKDATIQALKGADAPETTWFSDLSYRSGLSPTDAGPYQDPENYLTKQDVGHHFFKNAMFFAERQDNIKIIGNGRITGNGNLVTGDKVMNNTPDNRADKMFSLKLCTNIEIGGIYKDEDLWYDPKRDEPYYIQKDNSVSTEVSNMLNIDRAGHFVVLATGSDNIHVHNTYFGKNSTSNVRDIYDFMACNNVTVTNIYCKVSSDDIVKPGSDCSLGFTRPARHYMVRNIIGDTNCNLFQIGSETADDIMDVHVDNIYVLGANKAGFSISTNDGGHVKDVHLNCGHTGPVHSRSKMFRTTTPFFISISNRARILGSDVSLVKFVENGVKHDELLVNNVNIGQVENILINGVDISEVYSGSSFGNAAVRWKAYDGTQKRSSPIIAGYRLPDPSMVEGGLNFKLPNGHHTGYIKNVAFNDVNILVKGGNPAADTAMVPPELGVGQYNISNLKVQPSYGLWARHVVGLKVQNCSFNFEKRDRRYPILLDDVNGAVFSSLNLVKAKEAGSVLRLKSSSDVTVENVSFYDDEWGKGPLRSFQRLN